MENKESVEPDEKYLQAYIKGYNDGFILAEHQPDILDEITKNVDYKNLPYFKGLEEGGRKYAIDKILDRSKEQREEISKRKKVIKR